MPSASRLGRLAVTALLTLTVVPRLFAQGWIEPPRPMPTWGVQKIRSAVSVVVSGRVARVTVEEWFRNNGPALGEGIYHYPLSGEAVLQGISPLVARVGEQVFDRRFSLTDDPLLVGRAASRPLDDECVHSRTTCLVERGVVQQFIYDLETATRARTHSTGHGQRSVFGKPVPGYTNLVLGVGDQVSGNPVHDLGGGLLAAVTDGLLVDELIGVGQGNVIGGAFSHPVALAYRVERGAISGRVKDAAVAGNAYDLWKRVGDFGNDGRWAGARYTASVLLDGVSVARR